METAATTTENIRRIAEETTSAVHRIAEDNDRRRQQWGMAPLTHMQSIAAAIAEVAHRIDAPAAQVAVAVFGTDEEIAAAFQMSAA